jgi:hypothetical protein
MLSAPRPVGVSVWVRKNSKQVIGQKKCEKSPEILRFQDFSGCGGRTRTYGLRVMSSKQGVCYRDAMSRKVLILLRFLNPSFYIVE